MLPICSLDPDHTNQSCNLITDQSPKIYHVCVDFTKWPFYGLKKVPRAIKIIT
uniref:Uncharacterized protein n=1 Tax=Arundo donax TaxID=35708 RepID=A0A0A8Z3E5_ARUDO